MSRTLLAIALLIPLGCRGEFDIDKYLADDAGTDEQQDSETGSNCPSEQIELGDGCFGHRHAIEGLTDPTDLVLAELANAGQLDLLVAGPELNFFLGSAGGQFGAAVPLSLGGRALAVVELDADPLVDFAAIAADGTALRVATGGGSFSDAGTIGVAGWDGLFADLDNDGDDDLVVSGAELQVALVDGASADVVTVPVAGQGLALTDINEDGAPDLALAGTTDDVVYLLANDGAGAFSVENQYQVAQAYDVAFLDVDDDGRDELLAVDSNNGNLAVVGIGPSFNVMPRAVHVLGRVPRRLALGDVDGDGTTDVVTANRMNGDLSILLGNGSGLDDEIRVPTIDAGDQYEAVAIADLDGGGRGEIIVTAPGTGRVRIFGYVD